MPNAYLSILIFLFGTTAVILILHFIKDEVVVVNSTKVTGEVFLTKFDSDGNIYVLADLKSNSSKLHKLTPNNELLWTIFLPRLNLYKRPKILVTSQNDLYLRWTPDGDAVTYLSAVKSDSSKMVIIDKAYRFCPLFILDSDDNLFYCGENKGVRILRPNSTIPIGIKNLEDRIVYREECATVDREGNVYLAIAQTDNIFYDDSLALITKEEIHNGVPKAQLIDFIQKDKNLPMYVSSLIVDEENSLWLFITDRSTTLRSYVKKLTNNVLKTVYVDYLHHDLEGLVAKDRIYVRVPEGTGHFSISYVTKKDEILEIPALKNINASRINEAVNKDGDVYFALSYEDRTPVIGPLVVIKAGQANLVPIEFHDSFPHVLKMKMDYDEKIWFISGCTDLFTLEKEETVARLTSRLSDDCSDISFNPMTNLVYISCQRGLLYIER